MSLAMRPPFAAPRSPATRPSLAALLSLCAVLASPAALAQADKPQYGGTVNVGTLSVTFSPQSWDPADWNYKTAEDAGFYYDRLFAGDMSKSRSVGGPYSFKSDSYLPGDAVRGDLAEKWRWLENPLRLEITLRKGVMFPDKPGVMAARELTAQDVAYSYNRLFNSPKKIADFIGHVEKVEATDRHTVVMHFKHFYEDWGFRLGWGPYSAIYPKEVVDAGISDWRKANGSGPFQIQEYVNSNSQTYAKNPLYWDKAKIGGVDYKVPFVDRVVMRIIKDEATRYTALRTAKLDILQAITWSAAEELKKNAPQLQWSRWLSHGGRYLAMRTDTKPFDDMRVRRAMNMAVNKQEIVSSFYGGNAEAFAYPQHPDYGAYFEPLASMPESIRELYTYDPVKAKKLLADAGYPRGFSFKAQVCTCSPEMMDLAPLVAAYLEKVGVKVEFETLEQGAFYSLVRNGKNAPGMFFSNSHGAPTTSLRKNFLPNQYTNNAQWNDPAFEKKLMAAIREPDEPTRQRMVRELTRDILEKSPYLWLPTPYIYAAWWPWVKNYSGEIYSGGFRTVGIYTQVWIDLEMKKKMGY